MLVYYRLIGVAVNLNENKTRKRENKDATSNVVAFVLFNYMNTCLYTMLFTMLFQVSSLSHSMLTII